MLLGRQGRHEGFRSSSGRRGGFKGSLLPNVAFWNQKKISRKAPGRWPKDMLLGRQGRHEGFRGRSERRGGFKGSLLPNVAFWNQKKISRKAPGRWPKDMLLGCQGRHEGFKGSSGRKIARKAPGRWPKDMLLGRREAFNGSLLPNVAFWNQKKRCREATFSRARSPCRWLGSADIYIYICIIYIYILHELHVTRQNTPRSCSKPCADR